jgi:hypothetical protein
VTSVAAPLLHHAATVFSCLSEFVLGYLTITIAIHAIKGSAPSLALRNETVAISIHVIETRHYLFCPLSRNSSDFFATYLAIPIRIHSHFRRIATLRHSKLVKANGTITIGIHLLHRIFHPLATLTVVTMTVGHSRHCYSTHD